MQRLRHRAGQEDGQALVMMTLFMVVIIGLAAIVIDGGRWFTERRDMQGVVDAAVLAGIRELPEGTDAQAEFVAEDYALTQNVTPGATVAANDATGDELTMTLTAESPGFLTGVLGQESATITVDATARLQQAAALPGMLPMAFMRDSYTLGDNNEVKFDNNVTGNRGAIRPPSGEGCGTSSGANDFGNIIRSSAWGGVDACAVMPGDTVNTETGNMSGQSRAGFDDRVSGNTQSLEDVFEYDPTTDRYVVIDPDSPRLGIVPVIENVNGDNTWPNGSSAVRILYYVLVYIGKTDEGNVPWTNNGRSVWVTPLSTILPAEWEAEFADYDPSREEAPISHRLIE